MGNAGSEPEETKNVIIFFNPGDVRWHDKTLLKISAGPKLLKCEKSRG
jgi:hypothetical protein